MSRKRCVRRVWALVNPIDHAINGACITPKDSLDKLRLLELSALEAFKRGRATVSDWKAIADMHNLSEQMGESGIGPEALTACEASDAALTSCRLRYRKTGKMGVSALELRAFEELFEYHDLQRQSIGRGDYEKQINRLRNRIRSAPDSARVTV